MKKVYIVLCASSFTSQTTCQVFSNKEKALKQFRKRLKELDYNEIFDDSLNSDYVKEGNTAEQDITEFIKKAMEELEFIYNGDGYSIEQVSLIEEEVN